MTEQTMFWITRADEIKNSLACIDNFLMILIVISTIACLISFVVKKVNEECVKREYLDTNEDYRTSCAVNKLFSRILFVCVPLLFIFFTANTLTPTTKDFVAIKVVPAILNNEKLKNISSDFIDIAEQWLKDLKRDAINL